jgi:hypothetical protein
LTAIVSANSFGAEEFTPAGVWSRKFMTAIRLGLPFPSFGACRNPDGFLIWIRVHRHILPTPESKL